MEKPSEIGQAGIEYTLESARTPYDRGLDHMAALTRMDKESPLVEHCNNDHNGRQVEFEMTITGYQIRPLDRQTEEASKIEEFRGDKILNRRGEWGQNLPPKLSLEDEDKTNPKRKNPREEKQGKRETENATDETPEPKNSGDEEKPADEPPASKKSRKVKKSPMGAPISTQNVPPPRSQHLSVKQILERMNKMRHDAK